MHLPNKGMYNITVLYRSTGLRFSGAAGSGTPIFGHNSHNECSVHKTFWDRLALQKGHRFLVAVAARFLKTSKKFVQNWMRRFRETHNVDV